MKLSWTVASAAILCSTLCSAADEARTNGRPLLGLTGYYVFLVSGYSPELERTGLSRDYFKKTLESRLRTEGLLVQTPDRSGSVGWVNVDFTMKGPIGDAWAWRIRLRVRELARLDRAADQGSLLVSSWEQDVLVIDRISKMKASIEEAFDNLVSEFLEAHRNGGTRPPF